VNVPAITAIYRFEMARTFRTLMQSIASPVLSTSLYFVVFGAAIGSRMGSVDGVSYARSLFPASSCYRSWRERIERILRDLPAEMVGHDL